MQEHQIDTVMHLAAQTSVDDSYERPIDSVISNITGTYTLLECSRKVKVQKFVYMSTDEVYGPCGPDEPADEGRALRPTNPYSASKASGEMLAYSYHRSYKLPVIVIRSNNAYGPHQYPESKAAITYIVSRLSLKSLLEIIPKFCLRIQREEKLTVMDKGLQSRCYLFVKDLVNALDTILHKHQGTDYAIYNIASTENFTTLGVTLKVLAAFGFHGEEAELLKQWVVQVPDRPFHDMHYFTNCDRLKALGWRQLVDFNEGLKITAEWYKALEPSWWKNVA